MSTLADLFDLAELRRCVEERLVVARKHPSCDLTILNYTERCQYERGNWNAVTLACRGLIHDGTGRVVARPFRKFFNYGQGEGGEFDPSARVVVTDKLDGSLGILYRRDGYHIATRGSFESEQAQHGTQVWFDRYSDTPVPVGWTLLFEIVYPSNRIVLDYGERDDLVLLGAVEIATGKSVGPNAPILSTWTGPRAETFAYPTLADALNAPPRANAEGLVVHFLDTDERLKIKQADYVALHRIVTGLNERTVWQHLVDGKSLDELKAALPDEFHGWVDEVADRLLATVERQAADVERAYSAILATLPPDHTRKDFALQAKTHPFAQHLFSRADGKNYWQRILVDAKPSARLGPNGIAPTEDAA